MEALGLLIILLTLTLDTDEGTLSEEGIDSRLTGRGGWFEVDR